MRGATLLFASVGSVLVLFLLVPVVLCLAEGTPLLPL